MRTRSLFRVVPWLVLLAMSLPVAAQSAARSQERAAASAAAAPACLVLEQGWIRMPPAPRPMLAGFGRIANHCGQPQVVVAARSPRFGEVSLHQTRVVDGVSRMRELERLPIAAGGQALLQPGGLHLMLMQPDSTLVEGQGVPLVLVLDDGRELQAQLVVSTAAPAKAAISD